MLPSRPLLRAAATLVALAALAGPAAADERAAALQKLTEAAKPSLVTVELTSRVAVERLPGLGEGARRIVRSDATGVVVSDDGLVAFAACRVDPAAPAFALLGSRARAEVEKVLVLGADGKAREAAWIGRDEERGLAYVRVGAAGRAGLVALTLSESSAVPGVGEEVAVLSLTPRVLGRALRVDVTRIGFVADRPRRLLGTSPAVAHAHGGLAYRLDGSLVGIVVGLPASPGAEGAGPPGKDVLSPDVLAAEAAGYVLPAADLRASVAKPPTESRAAAVLRRKRAWLGVRTEVVTPELAKLRKLPVDDGVRIAKVYKGTPAEKAGLGEGDVITRLDGELVSLDPGESFRTLEDQGVGQKLRLTVVKDGKNVELEVALAEAPLSPEDAPRQKVAALDALVRDLTFFDRDELGLPETQGGVVVVDLDADGGGSRAGLRLQDAVLQVDGKDVPGADALAEALAPGERSLTVRRGGEKLTFKVRR